MSRLAAACCQAVQLQPGRSDHRATPGRSAAPAHEQYAPAHPVDVVPGGVLESLLGTGALSVNSLHGQGVARLAEGLRVEAVAPDGLVEAFSMPHAPAFNLCVQWHPEWQAADNPVSVRLLSGLRRGLPRAATSSRGTARA